MNSTYTLETSKLIFIFIHQEKSGSNNKKIKKQ